MSFGLTTQGQANKCRHRMDIEMSLGTTSLVILEYFVHVAAMVCKSPAYFVIGSLDSGLFDQFFRSRSFIASSALDATLT